MTTPHRKPTPRKAKRIKARKWRVISESLSLRKGGENTATLGDKGRGRTIATLDVSDEQILINQVKISLDTEDGTGAGYDWAAWKVLHDLGIIKKGFLK